MRLIPGTHPEKRGGGTAPGSEKRMCGKLSRAFRCCQSIKRRAPAKRRTHASLPGRPEDSTRGLCRRAGTCPAPQADCGKRRKARPACRGAFTGLLVSPERSFPRVPSQEDGIRAHSASGHPQRRRHSAPARGRSCNAWAWPRGPSAARRPWRPARRPW